MRGLGMLGFMVQPKNIAPVSPFHIDPRIELFKEGIDQDELKQIYT